MAKKVVNAIVDVELPKDLLKKIPSMMMSCLWDAYMVEGVTFEENDWEQFVMYSDMYFKGESVSASSVTRTK